MLEMSMEGVEDVDGMDVDGMDDDDDDDDDGFVVGVSMVVDGNDVRVPVPVVVVVVVVVVVCGDWGRDDNDDDDGTLEDTSTLVGTLPCERESLADDDGGNDDDDGGNDDAVVLRWAGEVNWSFVVALTVSLSRSLPLSSLSR